MKHPQKYKVSILVEVDTPPNEDPKEQIKKDLHPYGFTIVSIDKINSIRSLIQNNALHKWFDLMAQEFNEKGLDVREVVRKDFKIPWTGLMVKEILWKKVQKTQTGKKSTTKLDRNKEINLIYDTLNRVIIDRWNGNVNVPDFPSMEAYENSILQ